MTTTNTNANTNTNDNNTKEEQHSTSGTTNDNTNGRPDDDTDETSSSSSSITTSTSTLFQTITSMVQNSSPPLPLPDDIKLQLYGLYKRSTIGTTTNNNNNTDSDSDDSSQSQPQPIVIPSVWNIVAYRKYQAWDQCNDLTVEESMIRYMQLVAALDCDLGRECLTLLEGLNCQSDDDRDDDRDDAMKEEAEEEESTTTAATSIMDQNSTTTTTTTTRTKKQKQKQKLNKMTNIQPSTTKLQLAAPSRSPSFVTKLTGIKPFTPRGQLDISTIDLISTLIQTLPLPFNNTSMRTTIQLENDIAKTWNANFTTSTTTNRDNIHTHTHTDSDSDSDSIITGLSVRSLLDLYLTAKSYPTGSEVIIIPPISIEGLMDVVQYHGIKVIPIDIDDFEQNKDDNDSNPIPNPIIQVNIEKVKNAITTKTVGVLVVHPFGLVCMDETEMKELKLMVKEECRIQKSNHEIEIWEDCAECFTGGVVYETHGGAATATAKRGYCGSAHVDVQFFSFGTIKTATALGGGIAVLKGRKDDGGGDGNQDTSIITSQQVVAEKMKRLQHMTYTEQSKKEYLMKTCKALILNFLARNLIILGFVIRCMDICGLDYDHLVTSAVKGFAVTQNTQNGTRYSSKEIMEQKKLRGRKLIKRLRKRPCPALLSLLHRRLRKFKQIQRNISSRTARCAQMERLLKANIPSIQMPTGSTSSQHLFWLFPFLVDDPVSVCKYMKRLGYDVPRGTSQLGCVTSFLIDSDSTSPCPNTEQMMKSILYLPTASTAMTKPEMQQLAISLRDAVQNNDTTNKTCEVGSKEIVKHKHSHHYRLLICLATCFLPFSSRFRNMIHILMMVFIPSTLLAICCLLVILHAMRLTIGRYYLNCSNAFAKYNSIFCESSSSTPSNKNTRVSLPSFNESGLTVVDNSTSFEQSSDLFESETFEIPTIKRLSTHTIDNYVILTGGTGFIGSLLLRDLLFYRKQLCISGVVLICRSKRKLSAAQRIEKLLGKPMFSFLSDKEKRDSVIVMEGDVASPNIGMTAKDLKRLYEELNVTHVFNCAACVNFTEPLESAAESNITSALQLQRLTKKLKNKHATYVYLSTAFIHGNQNGSTENPLSEDLFNFGHYNPEQLYESMMNTQSYASKAMHDLGFPNTYTFSKSICEHILMNEKDVKTIIIRPSIVGPSIQEPHEGWAGEKPSTLVAGACLYMKNPFNLWTFRREQAAVVPVDVVCRFVLAKAFQKTLGADQFSAKDDERSKSSEDSCRSSELSYVFTQSSTMQSYLSETDSSQCLSEESIHKTKHIFTAAWDSKSTKPTGFLWYDFACAIVQLSTVNGHVEISLAYFVLMVSFKIFLALNLTFISFQKVHRVLVHGPFLVLGRVCGILGLNPKMLRDLEKVRPFLDLPLLFFPFTTTTFNFSSELIAPSSINGERYMFSCILAAERFIKSINSKISGNKGEIEKPSASTDSSSTLLIGGENFKRKSSDIWWALTQPKGNYTVRLVGFITSKLLRLITTEVTLDMVAMAKIARAIEESTDETKPYIILAPTHRSYLDFIIISFISFSVPEIGVSIPYIAAADDFARIPVLGWFARMAGAFFLSRGKGIADPGLKGKVNTIKKYHSIENPTCIEVFLEGTRSRDRRFLRPKTGFLRCLSETGGKHLIIPISVNYEAIPEQSSLAMEADGEFGNKMCIFQLFSWLKKAYMGEVKLGRIHVSASDPMLMEPSVQLEASKVGKVIQNCQQQQVYVSSYHIKASVAILKVDTDTVLKALQLLKCPLWTDMQHNELNSGSSLRLPDSLTERWTIFLQFGHIFSPFLQNSHPKWALWLNGSNEEPKTSHKSNEFVECITNSLIVHFEAAEKAVDDTLKLLHRKGFSDPSVNHIVQYTHCSKGDVSMILVCAAATMRIDNPSSKKKEFKAEISAITPLFRGSREMTTDDDIMNFKNMESFGAWGYKDSKFVVSVERDGRKYVTMNGDRYNISGRPMPNLISFLEKETNVKLDLSHTALSCAPGVSVTDCDLTIEDIKLLLNEVNNETNRISTEPLDRARHGTGHSQEDMFIIRNESLSEMRLPDLVIFPSDECEVQGLISLAAKQKWCLIPFGGGTNVSHATWCPSKDIDPRPMISVDMRLMSKVLKVNEEDSTVHVQAGITGGQLVREMLSIGYTIGHEPDSIEFSTVGGWIATNSSGMKQNKYGNIEDIVKEVRVANSEGIMWQHSNGNGASFGRVSTGTNLTSLVLGSEGSLGIITSAVLKIWPLPIVKEYQSVILHNFDDGIRFMKDVAKLGAMKPASIRLLDNTQFRLGQAMKWKTSLFDSFKRLFVKAYANLKAGEFLAQDIVCATVTFEGSSAEVELQQKMIENLTLKHGGLCAGSEIGKAGYDMTYAIAYIRDFAMTYGFLAESFETFVPWSKVANMITATKDRLKKEHSDRVLPGHPIVCCRITQLYDEGVCVYFYFCMNFENVNNPSEVFSEIESAARKEILSKGGSLSHHHGVGKAKAAMMDHVNSESLKNVLMRIKEAIDPENTFGVRNGSYA